MLPSLHASVRLWVLAWLALLALAGCGQPGGDSPRAVQGALDLRGWDFGRHGIAVLDGEWRFHWDEFADPRRPPAPGDATIAVPGAWNAATGSGFGRATYSLTVQCERGGGLALSLPAQHSAARWFVNGGLVAHQGEPGASLRGAHALPVQQMVSLDNVACPLHIVAQVSNFDLRRGGLLRSVELGEAAKMLERREAALVRDLMAIGGLMVLGVLPLLFYLGRRVDRSPLYFGLLCLIFGVGLALANTGVLQQVLAPLGWNRYVQLVFVVWYVNSVLFALFVRSLYPQEVSQRAVKVIIAWGVLSAVGVTFASSVLITRLLLALAVGGTLCAGYLSWRLVAAWRHGRKTAPLLLVGLAVLTAAIVHDVANYAWLTRVALLPYAVMVFVAVPAYLMARRFARSLLIEERMAIEQRERADLVVRSTHAGVLDWDAVKGRAYWSERLREMLKMPPEAHAPELPEFREFLHPDDVERVHGSFLRQLHDRSVASGVRPGEPHDMRLRRSDGLYVWVHAEAVSVCDSEGRTLRFICSFIDVSERKQHEADTEDRLKFINDLFDSVPLGLCMRGPDGRYLLVNRTWEGYRGQRRQDVIGQFAADRTNLAAQSALALDRTALGAPPGTVLTSSEIDERGRHYHQTRTVMSDSHGRPIGVLVASLDVTEKHAVEQALAVERERLALLVRSTKAGFGDWDAVRDVVTYSERFKEMLGYPADEDTSAWPSLFELMHPDDREGIRATFRETIRRRPPGEQAPGSTMSYRLRRRDGSYVWVHAEGISQVDAEGRTVRFITSYIDVTSFREQEAALRAQVALTRTEQRRLDLVVRGARVGIVDWDGRSHETYYSPLFREIRGYPPDADTSDWPDYFKVMIHPDDRERVSRRWVAFIRGKGPEGPRAEYYAPEEYRLLRADGGYAWVQVSGMAVRDERDFVVRWIAATIDVTERRAQAALLEQQNEALRENVRLREEVERIGRHDIKTPLNSIVSVPRLLREEGLLGPEADELLGIVERAGYRILSMVNLSLDLYKMEQGTYVFRPDAVDLVLLVDKVLADVRIHAAAKNMRFETALADAPYAWAEELLCYSLLANLIKNAVEASPEGATVSLRSHRRESGIVELRLHNVGAVPEPIRPTFFQKYNTLGKAGGTGLGTYSARLMARVQDGDITMTTSQEEGTTLSVTLRAAPLGVIPASVRHAAERTRRDPIKLEALPRRRVLLVDDDEYNLLIVRRFLPTPPFTVETAINGRMALAAAERNWPDIVIMDLDMPVMGGLQAVLGLRALELAGRGPRCTVVALSSHEDEATRQAALAAGFDRYLTKPVTRDIVHETLLALAASDVSPSPGEARSAPGGGGASAADPVLVDADMRPLMSEYLLSRRSLVASLPVAVAAGERTELRRLAHQLAGSLALYGFRWASEQCRWLEKNHADVDAQRVAALACELQAHLDHADIRFVSEAAL